MANLNRCVSGGIICIHRGDTSPLIYDLVDSAGVVFNGAGRTYRLSVTSIEDPPDATTLIFQSDAINIGTSIEFPLFPADVANLLEAFYDIQETDATARPLTIDKGAVEIRQDNTK